MIINLIATPRNLSTAIMYSFAQHPEIRVVDEPFYAWFLTHTGFDHPGREETLRFMPANPGDIFRNLEKGSAASGHLFLKNMAKHMEGVAQERFLNMENVILLRNPKQLIASFAKVIPDIDDSEIGLKKQFSLFEFLSNEGKTPVVFDSGELLKNPEKVLRGVCEGLNIPFSDRMLQWEAGPRPEDGPWAKYWYANVHKSTGFEWQKSSDAPLPPHCEALYEEVLPYYQKMYEHSIKA